VRAVTRFFRTPPVALRVTLLAAAVLELVGLAVGLGSLAWPVRDAFHAPSSVLLLGTLRFALWPLALHALLAAVALGAVLSARRAPALSVLLALGPLALAYRFVAVGGFGFSFGRRAVSLGDDTPWVLLGGASIHILLAALASALALAGVLFGLVRRGAAERTGSASNGDLP
jgi:hypothetical protein